MLILLAWFATKDTESPNSHRVIITARSTFLSPRSPSQPSRGASSRKKMFVVEKKRLDASVDPERPCE